MSTKSTLNVFLEFIYELQTLNYLKQCFVLGLLAQTYELNFELFFCLFLARTVKAAPSLGAQLSNVRLYWNLD
jgi:hypothetical protein